MTCHHKNLEWNLAHNAFEDSNVAVLEVKAFCLDCQRNMRFLGLPVGASLANPTTSLDGTECRVPFVPEGEEPDKAIGFKVTGVVDAQGNA